MSEREKFEKWFSGHILKHSENVKNAAWEAWQAALSTRKPYGYGIVDKYGDAAPIPVMSSLEEAESTVRYRNSGAFPDFFLTPYRVVELSYEEQS